VRRRDCYPWEKADKEAIEQVEEKGEKMKPKRCKAWGCSRCNTSYLHKNVAEMCCACIECGKPTPYTGQRQICERCGLTKTVESNLRYQEDLKKTLAEQQERLARLSRR
jgi:hypothetical protein